MGRRHSALSPARTLRLTRRVAAFVALIVLTGSPVHTAETSPATDSSHTLQLRGIVVDAAGSPAPGARVTLEGDGKLRSTRSNEEGRFIFTSLPPGIYALAAVSRGASAPEQLVSLVEEDLELSLMLLPPRPVEQVTVTAERIDEPQSRTAASQAVLDREALAVTAATRLDDALRQVAGYTLFRRTSSRVANPTTQGATLRAVGGSGAGRALVLDDGLPLNDPFGGWVAWGRVPRLAVDRIEVLRGSSSLYGSSALAGVVQMMRRSDEDPGIEAEAALGSQSTTDAALHASGAHGEWSGSFAAESFRTDGYILTAPEERGDVDIPASSDQRILELTGGRRVGGAGRLFARLSTFDEDRGNGTPLQRNATNLDEAAVGWDGELGGGDLRARVYALRESYEQTFSSVDAARDSETPTRLQNVPSNAFGLTSQWSRALAEREEILAGLEASRVRGTSRETLQATGEVTEAGGRQDSLAIFADSHTRIGERTRLIAGVRVDRWTNQGEQRDPAGIETEEPDRRAGSWGPRLSCLFAATPSVDLTASLWSSFRAPTLNELYRPFQAGAVTTLANADLGPETLRGWEAGAGFGSPAARTHTEARIFWTEVDDAILNVTLPSDPTGNTRQRMNVARTRSRGLELDFQARPAAGWVAGAGLLLADATVVDAGEADAALLGARVPQVPRSQATMQLRYESPRGWRLGAQARYSGEAFEDDRNTLELGSLHVLDLFASVPLARRLEAFVSAENVLDDRYETGKTPVTTLGLPRVVHAGIRVTWSPGP
ncbi:MAG TPA: TonB-dependent receptor [Candidatus Polarisedimenticolia bacterium]|nr:TonB-dependent receptor [Candidatus Polarisedimenticolia bacterium]